jgi:hypothetical protein
MLLLLTQAIAIDDARAAECPPGTVKVGERREETPTAIIVRPVCKRKTCIQTANDALLTCNEKLKADIGSCRSACVAGSSDRTFALWYAQLVSKMRASLRKKFEVRTPSACCCVRGSTVPSSGATEKEKCVSEICNESCLATYEPEGRKCVEAHKAQIAACGIP